MTAPLVSVLGVELFTWRLLIGAIAITVAGAMSRADAQKADVVIRPKVT